MDNERPRYSWENISAEKIASALAVITELSAKPYWDSKVSGTMINYLREAQKVAPSMGFWDKVAEWFRDNKEQFEETHLLTNKLSIPSGSGWSIHHPLRDGNITYKEEGQDNLQSPNYSVKIDKSNTDIFLNRYEDSLKRTRVLYKIGDNNSVDYSSTIQRYLNNIADDALESDIVVFTKGPQIQKIFRVAPADDSNMVGLVALEQVRK